MTAVRNRATAYWLSLSLPYPEPGLRLIRQADLDEIHLRMNVFHDELIDTVTALDERLEALKSAARGRLGRLYNSSDYPESLTGLFDVTWAFPSVEPTPYLQQLSLDLYRQECAQRAENQRRCGAYEVVSLDGNAAARASSEPSPGDWRSGSPE